MIRLERGALTVLQADKLAEAALKGSDLNSS